LEFKECCEAKIWSLGFRIFPESINAISKLPDSSDIDDIMYQLYVIDKIRKGEEAIKEGKVISIEELK
jgi:hypothetical protein